MADKSGAVKEPVVINLILGGKSPPWTRQCCQRDEQVLPCAEASAGVASSSLSGFRMGWRAAVCPHTSHEVPSGLPTTV